GGGISGTEHLANSAVEFILSPTAEELSLEAAILAENILRGNVCADGILQDAKNTLDAAKKSAAELWDKVSHASLGDQAEMAASIVGIIRSLFIGAGEVEVAESVSRASEVTRADELSETINTLDRTVNVAGVDRGTHLGSYGENILDVNDNGVYINSKSSFIIEQSKQNKHIPGTNEYKIASESGLNKSILSVSPYSLLSEIGSGVQVGNLSVGMPGSKERIDFIIIIGNYIERDTGVAVPTSKGIVHYSKKGVHIVPSRP
ncbi:polymorphic toxin type 50 domain-containing protein, partial [Rahnella ecdela]